jgi:hypothetical protein
MGGSDGDPVSPHALTCSARVSRVETGDSLPRRPGRRRNSTVWVAVMSGLAAGIIASIRGHPRRRAHNSRLRPPMLQHRRQQPPKPRSRAGSPRSPAARMVNWRYSTPSDSADCLVWPHVTSSTVRGVPTPRHAALLCSAPGSASGRNVRVKLRATARPADRRQAGRNAVMWPSPRTRKRARPAVLSRRPCGGLLPPGLHAQTVRRWSPTASPSCGSARSRCGTRSTRQQPTAPGHLGRVERRSGRLPPGPIAPQDRSTPL